VLAMAFIPDQRTPLIFGVISLALLLLAFGARRYFSKNPDIGTIATEPHQNEEW
jgi:GABA permease